MDNLDDIMKNSYKNFHAEGFDYLCIQRHPACTKKVYFFDRIQNRNVVSPHNHKYNFNTTVLAGELVDTKWQEHFAGIEYCRYSWDTPLNGGSGFDYKHRVKLRELSYAKLTVGSEIYTPIEDIHSIYVKPQTVLLLEQYEDVIEGPTSTYFPNNVVPPSSSGLYEKFTEKELKIRIKQYERLIK